MKFSSLFKDIFFSYIGFFLMQPLGYLLRIIYARSLTLEEFGLIYGVITLFALINIIAEFGLNDTFRYFGTKLLAKTKDNHLRTLFWKTVSTQIITTIGIGIFLFFGANFLATHYFHYPAGALFIKGFTIYFILNIITNSAKNLIVIHHKQAIGYFYDFIRQLFLVIITYFLVTKINAGLDQLALVWIITQILFSVLMMYYIYRKHATLIKTPSFKPHKLKEMKFSTQIFISNIGTVIFQTIDIYIITLFFGVAATGIYSNGLSVIALMSLFLAPITVFIIPLFAKIPATSDRMKQLLNYMYTIGLYLILPISVLAALFSQEYILIIFGSKFAESILYVRWFALFIILKSFFGFNFNILTALGEVKIRTKILIITIVFNIVFDLISAIYFGMQGIAVVTGISWLIAFIMSTYAIVKKTNYRMHIQDVFKIILATGLFIGIVKILQKLITANVFVEIGLIIIISYSAYLGIGRLLRIYNIAELKELIMVKTK